MSARFGSGVYSYVEPSLVDKHAVSTMSSPYRVMLACEVNLPDPHVEIPRSSGIVKSVSHYTHVLVLKFNTNALDPQHEQGPLVFVSGAEAIVPTYLILYSKPSITSPTESHGRMSVQG